jgi:glycogen operon protein
LNDLVSFDRKHNEINGEGNRDGADTNLSWNCGIEGPTTDKEVEDLRKRQIKNFLTLNVLSIGTPMLLMGDEVRRSQNGNNNAFCQNNELSWFDWSALDRHADILRFARELIALWASRDLPRKRANIKLTELLREAQPIQWHGVKLHQPDWGHQSHSLAATVPLLGYPRLMHLMLNAYWEPLEFELPAATSDHGRWRRCVDTFQPSPDDIRDFATARFADGPNCRVEPRSIVILFASLE